MSSYIIEISTLLLGLVSAAVGLSLLWSIDANHMGDMKRQIEDFAGTHPAPDHHVTIDGRTSDLDHLTEKDIDRIKRKLATG